MCEYLLLALKNCYHLEAIKSLKPEQINNVCNNDLETYRAMRNYNMGSFPKYLKGLAVPHLTSDDVEVSDLDTNLDDDLSYNHRQGSQRSHSRVTTTNDIQQIRSRHVESLVFSVGNPLNCFKTSKQYQKIIYNSEYYDRCVICYKNLNRKKESEYREAFDTNFLYCNNCYLQNDTHKHSIHVILKNVGHDVVKKRLMAMCPGVPVEKQKTEFTCLRCGTKARTVVICSLCGVKACNRDKKDEISNNNNKTAPKPKIMDYPDSKQGTYAST